MQWQEATIYTTHEGVEVLEALLYSLDIGGLSILDEADFDEFLEENEPRWDFVDEALEENMRGETRVTFYLPDSPSGNETMQAVRAALALLKENPDKPDCGRLTMEINGISEEDWANNWKQFFHPIPVGKRILICPVWEQVENPENRIIFSVDPGMTFGSGQHETTRLCVAQLENLIFPGARVLDLGAGSGILSIIAKLLGAGSVTAVDVDPYCDKIIRQNAVMNGFDADSIEIFIGDLTSDEELLETLASKTYDVILANIVADVIVALCPYVPRFMTENSRFLCSGIIEDKADRVKAALKENQLQEIAMNQENDWVSILCKK